MLNIPLPLVVPLYILLAGIFMYVLSRAVPWSPLIKAAPIFLLAFVAALTNQLSGPTRWLLLAALILSAAGDIFLELDDDGDYFVPGLGSFLIAHIFYAIAFAQSRAFENLSLIPMVLIVALGIFVTWRIWSGLDELKIPVVLYILVSMGMGFSAAVHSPLSWILILGAIIFMISDSIIAWDKFWTSVRGRSFWVMGTYYAAQLLIMIGMISSA